MPLLSFKGTTMPIYWKYHMITHNKKQTHLLNLLINSILARSGPQMVSMKDECTFRFSDFLIIFLCNFSATSWFEIILLLIALLY